MISHAFCRLLPVVQLYRVLYYGTYLAQRWDDESGVNLYHCAGDSRGQAVVLRSFSAFEARAPQRLAPHFLAVLNDNPPLGSSSISNAQPETAHKLSCSA